MFSIYSNIFYIRRTVVYLGSFKLFGFQLCEFLSYLGIDTLFELWLV